MKHLFAALVLLFALGAQAKTWPFVLIGDTPYSDDERSEFPLMLESIVAENPAFIVHIGDIKTSHAKCSDDIFLDRYRLFETSRVPFILTPGDNEWTDCKNLVPGHFNELERLGKLREIFFARPFSIGQTRIPVEQQSAAYPENLRWRLGPVIFLTLNVPGPDNNFGNGEKAGAEFLARNPKLVDWLKSGFSVARREKATGIVIAMQGDPALQLFDAGLAHRGFRELLETLRRETLAFPGQVLLLHGDTHWQRIDHPLHYPGRLEPIANFTRVESFGYPFMGWVKIIIDSEDPALFRFEVHRHKTDRFAWPITH